MSYHSKPRIEIIEQPAPSGYCFHYDAHSYGLESIPGINSTEKNPTFPTIRIVGLKTSAEVTVSCVTARSPYKVHPHKLVPIHGQLRIGIIRGIIPPSHNYFQLAQIAIRMTNKSDFGIEFAIRRNMRIDPFNQGYNHDCARDPVGIDVNALRLCFEARLLDTTNTLYTETLKPVISWPIYNKFASTNYRILDFEPDGVPITGGAELRIWGCQNLTANVGVRFSDIKNCGSWDEVVYPLPRREGESVTAIMVRTPAYRDPHANRVVSVNVNIFSTQMYYHGEPSILSLYPKTNSQEEREIPEVLEIIDYRSASSAASKASGSQASNRNVYATSEAGPSNVARVPHRRKGKPRKVIILDQPVSTSESD